MSLLDIRQAKEALAWRLKEWNVDGDPIRLAASFIDDLVEKGWRMDATREDRPRPPRPDQECSRHAGQHRPPACGFCRMERQTPRTDDPPSPDLPPAPPSLAARLARIGSKESDA